MGSVARLTFLQNFLIKGEERGGRKEREKESFLHV